MAWSVLGPEYASDSSNWNGPCCDVLIDYGGKNGLSSPLHEPDLSGHHEKHDLLPADLSPREIGVSDSTGSHFVSGLVFNQLPSQTRCKVQLRMYFHLIQAYRATRRNATSNKCSFEGGPSWLIDCGFSFLN